MSLSVDLLGPLVVRADGREIAVAGARLRALLCRLAVDPGRRVSATELVDAVWPDDPPAEAGNALQSLVSRLRRGLADGGLLTQESAGYRLELGAADTDAATMAARLTDARRRRAAGDLAGAQAELDTATALWRGEPLADAGRADYAEAYRRRWSKLHRTVVRERLDLAVLRGAGRSVVGELEEVVAASPLDEPMVALLLRVLSAEGRNAEALDRFEQTRRQLADELGTDPGRELQELHLALLRGEVEPASGVEPSRAPGRSNLRSWLTSFVGRAVEVERVLDTVRSHRLTTVVGPGGAGKTRLATEVAAQWLAGPDRTVWLIELAPVTEEANIPAAILGALGLRDARVVERPERPAQDPLERLVNVLRDADCLLVVDNCEHLIDAAAAVLDRILAHAPAVRVLTTSREPLGILGEALVALPTLALPSVGCTVEQARSSPAVRLWLDRARSANGDFVLDDTTVGPVVEIVRRLDGLPLALELAAAKLRVLPLTEVARRLSDRFRLLTGGNRTALPRHRTLRAVVEWSWDLLSVPEKLLAERLAVFPAGADLASATAVCADERLPAAEVDSLLFTLVDKSLLQSFEVTDAAPGLRFRMLETIREFGVERLADRSELDQARLAHARHFARVVLDAEPMLRGPSQLEALAVLELERENVLTALRYLGDSGRGREALHLCLALVWYWWLLGSSSEATTWLRFVLQVDTGDDPSVVFARAALALTEVTADHDEVTVDGSLVHDAERARNDIIAVSEALPDAPRAPFPGLEAQLPMVARFAERPDLAARLTARGMASDDRWLRAAVQATIAFSAENDSDLELMRSNASAAYQEFAEIGDRWGQSSCLMIRARLATLEGQTQAAIDDYQTAWGLLVQLGGADEDEIFVRIRLADLHSRLGDYASARRQLADTIAESNQPGRSRDRGLWGETALTMVEWLDGDLTGALLRARRLRVRLAESPLDASVFGHLCAVVLSVTGAVEALGGDRDQAYADLAEAYPAGVRAGDMPILAGVGLTVALWAQALGRYADAAVILGAAAEVRGADDFADATISRLVGELRTQLVDFETPYAKGRSLSRTEAIARLDPELLRG